jgi:hypothetical protein
MSIDIGLPALNAGYFVKDTPCIFFLFGLLLSSRYLSLLIQKLECIE